jgi:hypothetical protein
MLKPSAAATKPTAETAKVVSLSRSSRRTVAHSPPMIPAMEHRVFSALTLAVVAGLALLVVLYGLWAVLMLIVSYGD